ncbi:MAG: hypothetical protein LBE84_02940, partial [Planctomycetota bacterium]|nr:hypothetical protein [Planctomycetota bacterium]
MKFHGTWPQGPKKESRRGSALLLVMVLSLMIIGMVTVTLTLTREGTVNTRESVNYAQAEAAAEYGAELAISQLTSGLVKDPTGKTVVGDWVSGSGDNPAFFVSDSGAAPDQRRIGGVYGDYEF